MAALLLAAFGLTACQIKMSPLKTDFAFSPDSSEALVAVQAFKPFLQTEVVLRRVDFENRQFVRGEVHVTLRNSFVARALSASGEDSKAEQLFVRTMPPGDYAYIAKIENDMKNGQRVIRTRCFAKGTRVFRIEAGRMNLIDVLLRPLLLCGGSWHKCRLEVRGGPEAPLIEMPALPPRPVPIRPPKCVRQ